MEYLLSTNCADREFYGEHFILLEGVIAEFLSCLDMIRRYQVSQGHRDPIASFQARIKSAASMKKKLERQNLPVTVDSAVRDVWDAAGVRLVCPFVQGKSASPAYGGPCGTSSDPAHAPPQISPACLST